MDTPSDLIEQLRANLPIVFARKEVDKLLPGVISPKSLANMAALGKGPPAYHQGRTVIYNRDTFLAWLSGRISRMGRNMPNQICKLTPGQFFLRLQLRWLEGKTTQEFDRKLSLKIDKLHTQIEENTISYKQETGSLAGVIKAITKKATAAALQWFQPEAILRAALWTTKKRLNGSGKY